MKSPEQGFTPEQKNQNPTEKNKKFLNMLRMLTFEDKVISFRQQDEYNMREVLNSLKGLDFDNLDEFVNAIKTEVNTKKWYENASPRQVMKRVEEMVGLIKAWQEKQ